MLLVIVLVSALVLAAVAGLVSWIRASRSCGRTIEAPAGERSRMLVGDVLCRSVITSGSLARLELFDWGIRLRGMPLSRWIVPTWEARYSDLAIAELVRLRFSRNSVWFRLRGGADGIGFLSVHSQEILRELEKRDVPVNRAVTQVRSVGELYRAGDPRP